MQRHWFFCSEGILEKCYFYSFFFFFRMITLYIKMSYQLQFYFLWLPKLRYFCSLFKLSNIFSLTLIKFSLVLLEYFFPFTMKYCYSNNQLFWLFKIGKMFCGRFPSQSYSIREHFRNLVSQAVLRVQERLGT